MSDIDYIKEVRRAHRGKGKVICPVCNDRGDWGKGFVLGYLQTMGAA